MNSNPLICVIDDDPDYLLIIKHIFSASLPGHYTIRYFNDGTSFLSELSQMRPKPRLIIMDRHMPVINGYQILARLRQQKYSRYIPVMMMSAQATTEEIAGCYEAGVNSFIRKSTDFDQLQKTLLDLSLFWVEVNILPGDTYL